MICRSCGKLYFRVNKQKICRDCHTHGRVKEKKFYKVKEWKRFSWEIKEKLTEQYEIILTDHKTTKEKIKSIFKRNNPEKRKERRDKLFKKLKKIAKGVNSKSGNKKLKNFSMKLSDHKTTGNYDALISKRRVPKF